MKPANVTLPSGIITKARQVGNGNLSRGLRVCVDFAINFFNEETKELEK